MSNIQRILAVQLRETCKITRARWALWVKHADGEWNFGIDYGVGKARRKALLEFIQDHKIAGWLAGTLSSGRVRWKQVHSENRSLNCKRLYAFPNQKTFSILLVGTDNLEKIAENFFKVLAICSETNLHPLNDDYQRSAHSALVERQKTEPEIQITSAAPLDVELEASYNPEGVLSSVLEVMAASIPCEAALLSVRSGNIFRIQSVWNFPDTLRGVDISILEDEVLMEMVQTRQGLVGNAAGEVGSKPFELSIPLSPPSQDWLGVPLVVGKRVIGHLAFVTSQKGAFNHRDLQRVNSQAARLSYVVENAIVFAEAARYLQQLALLNELASAASVGVDTNAVARRVMERLKRTFNADRAGVFLLSTDQKTLREYGIESETRPSVLVSVGVRTVGYVVESGLPLRVNESDLDQLPETHPVGSNSEIQSELAVPLKYRGKVIGALSLGSTRNNSFSQQDEQLLIVIASHLAGLFENMRLNEETRERAHNLSLIHQVVRSVVGLTAPDEIADVAAELMMKNLSCEFAAVLLVAPAAISVAMATPELVKRTLIEECAAPPYFGIVGQVLKTGKGILVRDTDDEPFYRPFPGWQAGSAMCVPLVEGEHILGVINVERAQKHAFSENDYLALEALAGFMSSVVLSASRYQQLQDSVRQLQAVRETALDIAGDLDLDAVLKRIVHRAKELVGARGAELGLLDDGHQGVRVLVSETPWSDSSGNHIPILAGVAGRVAAFGEPLVINDYNSWNGRLYPEKEAPFKAVAGVPLKFKGEVIGTLTVIDNRPDWEFHRKDVQLLELLAPQVTVWIRNARLYQELQERIEAQRQAENRLIRSARLAAVGEMAAGVAHELNNPLTTVAGFVELILDELPDNSPHRPDLELVMREAQRARGVVRRLLDFSRPPENRHVRTDLNELVGDVLALVRHLVRTGGIEMTVTLADNLPWISVDPGQIKQVLLNLIHNAIQFMPQGGKLFIQTEFKLYDGAEWLTISVRDTGEGISKTNLDRIFEPFFTTRSAGTGTGLGLSVSYGIVTDHGGFIDVESQIGSGSCFSVYLPLKNEEVDG